MPRVSVVMPAYNDERYVAEAIQSVLAQTYQDFELVITDNGSSDGTANVIKSFQDPRIRLLSLAKNRGHCGGMNNSVNAAQGEFLALLNSDDAFYPDKLEKQVKFLDENPHVGIVFSYAEIIDKDSQAFKGESAYKGIFDRPNQENRFGWLRNFFLNDNCLCHPSALIRKRCQEDIGLFDERFALLLDLDYWIRMCLKYQIHILPERLTKFRVHESQGSAGKPETHSLHYLELSQVLKHYVSPLVLDHLAEVFPPETLKQMYIEKNIADIDREIEPFIISMLENVNRINQDLKPFLIGMLAFWVGRPGHRAFALDVLYQVYQNPKNVEKIREQYSYDFSNLIKIAKAQDIFGVVSSARVHTQLHYANKGLENLHAELNQVKAELEQSQTQLQQTQKKLEQLDHKHTLNAENKNLTLLSLQESKVYDSRLLEKAADAYDQKAWATMIDYLKQSLEQETLLPTEIVLEWIQYFTKFYSQKRIFFDISSLLESEEWKELMNYVLEAQYRSSLI